MAKKILVLLTMIVIIAPLFTGCGRKDAEEAASSQIIPVKVTPVERGNLAEIFNTAGSIEAKKMVNLSAKVAGRVAGVHVQLGDYVRENQVLIEMEKDDFVNQNKQVKAMLAQAETNYKLNKDNFERTKKLFADELVSQQQYDAAQTQLEVSESQLKQSQANVEVSNNQLANTVIKAPFNGFIGYCKINQGEMVNPGAPLLSVVDLSRVYVTVNLSDTYISQAKYKQGAEIILKAFPETTFPGMIMQIAPAADVLTKTFPVRIEIDNPSQKIKAGMLAEVKLKFNERRNVLKIPVEAIIDEIGKKSVFIVADDTAARRVVTLGVSDGKMVEIISGLTGKEQVVTLGQNNLDDQMKVVVK